MSGEVASWFIDGFLLSVPSHGRWDEGALWGLFYKGPNPVHEGSSILLLPSLWGLGFQHMNLRGTDVQSIRRRMRLVSATGG